MNTFDIREMNSINGAHARRGAPIGVALAPGLAIPILDTEGFETVTPSRADLVIVGNAGELAAVYEKMPMTRRLAVPVIALSPVAGADVSTTQHALPAALSRVASIAERVAGLSPQLLHNEDAQLGLLAYLVVRRKDLVPASDPSRPRVLELHERERFPDIDALAAALCSRSLLHAEFIERLNLCPGCRSARILVRDECPNCTSTRLCDHAVLHHYRCACQAPESDFRLADGSLRCPKCRQALHQVSDDYEVSSGYCRCEACNEIFTHPQLGFRCLDCASSGKAEDLAERDVYAYRLTEAGYAAVAEHA